MEELENHIDEIAKENSHPNFTNENLIQDFNSEEFTIIEMAEKYNVKESLLKSRLIKLKQDNMIGKKNSMGKLITSSLTKTITEPPPSKPKKKKEPGLKEMMKSISNNASVNENISTLHKEMLIEILHKIIVN